MSKSLGFDSLALHAGFTPDARHGSRAVPIHQTTSYMFENTEHAAALYNLEVGGHLYSRISNPTVAVLENRLAALDGGVGAVATSTGMAAVFLSVLALTAQGDHIVASSQMYGGNINLLEHTMARFGVSTSFVNPTDHKAIADAIKPNTKMIFGEVIGNPGLDVLDVANVAEIAHKAGVPLVLDATLNTPYLMQPIQHGANIVIHSLTKWIGGHGVAMGGIIVDGGNFDWGQNDRFPTLTEPHFAFQGVNLWEEFGPLAFAMRVRSEGMYNIGASLSPTNAFYILQGLETLGMRMERHLSNTAALLEFLQKHEAVAWVNHPNLAAHPGHELAQKQMPKGAGSIITMGVKGGRRASQAFIEAVGLASHLANVGDARTLVIHPGSTTHSHISAEAMKAAGLRDDLVRISVGLEDINDITDDFDRALKIAVKKKGK